jgi:hypothetical protein
MLRQPQILMRVDWVINPARVPKGAFEHIPHSSDLNRCTCVVHDKQDKRRFIRDIERTASEIQVIRQPQRPTR